MNRTKEFIQYSELEFNIVFIINNDGSFRKKTNIIKRINKEKYNKEYNKEYYKNNIEYLTNKHKKYNKFNRNKINKWQRKDRQKNPDKYRIYDQRKWSKRRGFGFKPINNRFKESHFHHLHINKDHDIGIFIPSKLHNSISHSNKDIESMNKINNAVIVWLLKSVYEAKIEKSL